MVQFTACAHPYLTASNVFKSDINVCVDEPWAQNPAYTKTIIIRSAIESVCEIVDIFTPLYCMIVFVPDHLRRMKPPFHTEKVKRQFSGLRKATPNQPSPSGIF